MKDLTKTLKESELVQYASDICGDRFFSRFRCRVVKIKFGHANGGQNQINNNCFILTESLEDQN